MLKECLYLSGFKGSCSEIKLGDKVAYGKGG